VRYASYLLACRRERGVKKTFGHPKAQPPAPQRRVLDYHALREKGVHYHINHLRRMWQDDPPKFPVPFKPTPGRLAWWEEEIDAWLERARKP
jgi:hypothetical protein